VFGIPAKKKKKKKNQTSSVMTASWPCSASQTPLCGERSTMCCEQNSFHGSLRLVTSEIS
jgi:hypothetical protein